MARKPTGASLTPPLYSTTTRRLPGAKASSGSPIVPVAPLATADTLNWWPSRWPADGAASSEFRKRIDAVVTAVPLRFQLRRSHLALQMETAVQAALAYEKTREAAATEMEAQGQDAEARRKSIDAQIEALVSKEKKRRPKLRRAEKNAAEAIGAAGLCPDDIPKLTVAHVRDAVARRALGPETSAGKESLVPTEGPAMPGTASKIAMSVVPFVAAVLPTLTFGSLTRLFRVADLQRLDLYWLQALAMYGVACAVEWALAEFAAHTAETAAVDLAGDPLGKSGVPRFGASASLWWLAAAWAGLSLAEGIGLQIIARSAHMGLAGADGTLPFVLYVLAGGAVNAILVGAYFWKAYLPHRLRARAAYLQFRVAESVDATLKTKEAQAAIQWTATAEFLRADIASLQERRTTLETERSKSLVPAISEGSAAVVAAADAEARGEHIRTEKAIVELVEALEPLPASNSAS